MKNIKKPIEIKGIKTEIINEEDVRNLNLDVFKNKRIDKMKDEVLNKTISEGKKELQKAVKRMNQRLRALEERGYDEYSNVYSYLTNLQYDKDTNSTDNKKLKRSFESSMLGETQKGQIKYRQDFTTWVKERISEDYTSEQIQKMSERDLKEKEYEYLRKFGNMVSRSLTGQTSTALGTAKVLYKGEKTFREAYPEFKGSYISVREFFAHNREFLKGLYSSQVALDILEKSNEQGLTNLDIEKMLKNQRIFIENQKENLKRNFDLEEIKPYEMVDELFEKFGKHNK